MDIISQYFINTDDIIWNNVLFFIQMGIAYFISCILIPSIVLNKLFKKKPLIYRVIFYQVMANIYINIVGFILAYFKTFNSAACVFFMLIAPLIVKIFDERRKIKNAFIPFFKTTGEILLGRYGGKSAIKNLSRWIKKWLNKFYVKYFKGRVIEWSFLILTMLYIIMFFGYPRFFNPAFGHTDEETHMYWISQIFKNNPFVTGLYPYGMHFLTSILASTYGINPDYGVLSFSVVSSLVLFLTLYMLVRSVFKSKYVSLFSFIIAMVFGMFPEVSYFRFSYIFPMEFSLIPVIVGIFALISVIKYKDRMSLFLFSLALAWSLFAHFYGTIFLVLICLAFGVIYIVHIVKTKMLLKFLLHGVIGLCIGIAPFGVGYIIGFEFERSIAWAIGVMTNDEDLINQGLDESSQLKEDEENKEDESLSFKYFSKEMVDYLYTSENMFYTEVMIALITLIYCVLGLIFRVKFRYQYMLYLFLASIWFTMFLLGAAPVLGLPAIVEKYRVSVFVFLSSIPLFAVFFQMIFDILLIFIKKRKIVDGIIIGLGVVGITVIFATNFEKDELRFTKIVSDADGKLVQKLILEEQEEPWTVVTTTNILHIIDGDGYHVEILDFLYAADTSRDFYIPTQSVYIVAETRTNGFEEITIDPYYDYYYDVSVPISLESAIRDDINIYNDFGEQRDRAYYFYRNTIMSRLHYLIEDIERVYPDQISLYYEDDMTQVYKIEQDPYFLLNLSLDYMDDIRKDDAEETENVTE